MLSRCADVLMIQGRARSSCYASVSSFPVSVFRLLSDIVSLTSLLAQSVSPWFGMQTVCWNAGRFSGKLRSYLLHHVKYWKGLKNKKHAVNWVHTVYWGVVMCGPQTHAHTVAHAYTDSLASWVSLHPLHHWLMSKSILCNVALK